MRVHDDTGKAALLLERRAIRDNCTFFVPKFEKASGQLILHLGCFCLIFPTLKDHVQEVECGGSVVLPASMVQFPRLDAGVLSFVERTAAFPEPCKELRLICLGPCLSS